MSGSFRAFWVVMAVGIVSLPFLPLLPAYGLTLALAAMTVVSHWRWLHTGSGRDLHRGVVTACVVAAVVLAGVLVPVALDFFSSLAARQCLPDGGLGSTAVVLQCTRTEVLTWKLGIFTLPPVLAGAVLALVLTGLAMSLLRRYTMSAGPRAA